MNNESLPFLSSQERLDAYNLILQGCTHLWSKNRLQNGQTYEENGEVKTTPDKLRPLLQQLYPLVKQDPYFLAHFLSYVMKQKNAKAKDLQVILTYLNSLSAADGTPFSQGSEFKKPNLRYVSNAAVHMMDPKLASRVLEVAELKFGISGQLNDSRHFSFGLRTALKKYLLYRENNLTHLRAIKKSGLGQYMEFMYRGLRVPRSAESAAILRWKERGRDTKFEASLINFEGLNDLKIAEKIRKEKLPVLGVLGALPRMTPVIAVAILEQATGNQAVILHATFKDQGLLDDEEVRKLYEEKIKGAAALDRVERIKAIAQGDEKAMMVNARSASRKEQTAGIGKVYLHIDDSGSMQAARQFAIDRGAILAECVNNPEENFAWGIFGNRGQILPLPQKFVKDGFASVLFGYRDGGSTDCYALYPTARHFAADVDVFVTDQEHTMAPLGQQIANFHQHNPSFTKPKVCVIIDFSHHGMNGLVAQAYLQNGIPVAILDPNTLVESALVVDAIKQAMLGPVAIIDEIMDTELLELPSYYYSL